MTEQTIQTLVATRHRRSISYKNNCI